MSEYTVWQLARMAGCADPESDESPGAQFLRSVESSVVDDEIDEDSVSEIADGCVPVYTHDRWQTFVDLAAYQEDVSELGEVDGEDLTRSVAGVALYMIAERLAAALIEARNDAEAEDRYTQEIIDERRGK